MLRKKNYLLTLLCLFWAASSVLAQSSRQTSVSLTNEEKALLEEQAMAKVMTFQEHCALIGAKEKSYSERKSYIAPTIELFVDKDRTIEVSQLGKKKPRRRTVEEYLLRLSMMNYQKVTIDSYDCHIANEFKKSVAMNQKHPGEEWYEGIVSVIQTFRGERGDYVYKDVVKRNLTVYTKKVVTLRGNRIRKSWIIQLGDIKVTEVDEKHKMN